MKRDSRIGEDLSFMGEVLNLARKGAGSVSPNPLVGCVVVKNNRIIGRGYHRYFGGPHAEVYAIRSAGKRIRGSTLYVNMEPCNHYGKTPPCTNLIIKKGIKRVVVGLRDPNPIVSGKGIAQLRKAHIQVDVGILQHECEKLNEMFTTFITHRRPFVTLKIAQTLDGKISLPHARSRWITNDTSRHIVHALRSVYDAVLVGAGTVRIDNPKLTVRHVRGRNPVRVVLDGPLSVNVKSSVFSRSAKTILFISERAAREKYGKVRLLRKKGVEVIAVAAHKTSDIPLKKILKLLAGRGIASVMVEGGAEVFQKFIKAKLVDKLLIFIAPIIAGEGTNVVAAGHGNPNQFGRFKDVKTWNLDGDILIEAYT